VRSGPGENGQEPKKRKRKVQWSAAQKKKDCDEPDLTPNEKTQPIQWTEQPTCALVAAGSLWLFTLAP